MTESYCIPSTSVNEYHITFELYRYQMFKSQDSSLFGANYNCLIIICSCVATVNTSTYTTTDWLKEVSTVYHQT